MERLDLVERRGQNHQENGWLEHPYDGINKIKSVLVDMGFEGFDVKLVELYIRRVIREEYPKLHGFLGEEPELQAS